MNHTSPPEGPKRASRSALFASMDAVSKSDRPQLGISFMVAGCFMLTVSDSAAKLLTESFSVGQVLMVKALMLVAALLLISPLLGPRRVFRVVSWRTQAVRAFLTAAGSYLFVSGLDALPLSTAATLALTGPLFVTALAPWFLRERIQLRRWLGLIVGFAGVVIIVRPTASPFAYAALLPIAAALSAAFRDIVTRHMATAESTLSMLFYAFVAIAVVGSVASWNEIRTIAAPDWPLFALAALAHLIALYLMIEAVRNAEAATVAPFKYTNLIWVTVFQLALWGDFPAWNVLLGAVVLIGAMLYLLRQSTIGRPTQLATG